MFNVEFDDSKAPVFADVECDDSGSMSSDNSCRRSCAWHCRQQLPPLGTSDEFGENKSLILHATPPDPSAATQTFPQPRWLSYLVLDHTYPWGNLIHGVA